MYLLIPLQTRYSLNPGLISLCLCSCYSLLYGILFHLPIIYFMDPLLPSKPPTWKNTAYFMTFYHPSRLRICHNLSNVCPASFHQNYLSSPQFQVILDVKSVEVFNKMQFISGFNHRQRWVSSTKAKLPWNKLFIFIHYLSPPPPRKFYKHSINVFKINA